MADLTFSKINETWMKVVCKDVYMELDLQDRFSFKIPNAQYDPRVKRGVWDGIKKLYNRQTKKMYCGLLYKVLSFAEEKEWSISVDPSLMPDTDSITTADLSKLVSELIKPHDNGIPLVPYDYQLEAVSYMLNMDRSVCLAATASGKSLMLYLAVRFYQMMEELDEKTIFITVPTISLVEQLYSDFENYSTFEGSTWHVNKYCQKISSKYPKFVEKQIVITTWQSMEKLPHDLYEDIGAIFIDECHTAQAATLTNLIEQATTCSIRHGLTGTLSGMECDELVVQGLLGPAKRIITAKEIIDSGRASPVEVNMVMLNYTDRNRLELAQRCRKLKGPAKYQAELEFINEMESRREFIYGMVDSLKGNSLVLFDRKETYGQQMYDHYKELYPETTFLITGDVNADERELIRLSMEDHDKAVIWASYGTMAMGVSIKKLHNMVLISSSKSKIRVLQSVGRMMRNHSEKDHAKIYDIVDNLTHNNSSNYMMKHAAERIQLYTNEQFPVSFMELDV
jgi:superfamily II DNA or RNA helicase